MPKILHIEDDSLIARLVATRLKPRAEMVWVSNSDDAIAQLQRTDIQFSAVLVDIELKGSRLSGAEFVKQMRGIRESQVGISTSTGLHTAASVLPYILLSAVITPDLETRAKGWGVHALLNKPIRFGALEEALTSAGVPLAGAAAAGYSTLKRS